MSIVAGFAPAKINLLLKVMSRRADGFHELESLVAFLDFCDSLVFCPAEPHIRQLHLSGRTDHIPADRDNLVLRAAEALTKCAGVDLAFRAIIHKRIPPGSGLAGGSSDAATALLALNEMCGLQLSQEQLRSIAASVGSDVAMFVEPSDGCCLIRGRGEIVQAVDFQPQGYCVLILPALHVSTSAVYAAWDAQPRTSNATYKTLIACSPAPEAWLDCCFNDLQDAAFGLHEQLKQLRSEATRIANRPVLLSGSGSALFTAFSDPAETCDVAVKISKALNVETVAVPFRAGTGDTLTEVHHADYGNPSQARAG